MVPFEALSKAGGERNEILRKARRMRLVVSKQKA